VVVLDSARTDWRQAFFFPILISFSTPLELTAQAILFFQELS
jgi:hypothetical protein